MSTVTTAVDESPGSTAPFIAAGHPTMSLRKKTFFMVAGVLAALMIILWLSLSWILVGRFSNVEKSDAAKDIADAGASLGSYFDPLHRTARDWSAWDESYRFVQDGNAAYREANLTAFGLTSLQIDLIAYVQPDSRITYGTSIDRSNETLYALPSSLTALLTPASPLVQGPAASKQVSGFLSLPEGTLLIVAKPILHDNGSGTSHGAFIIGRYLSWLDLEAVKDQVRLKSLVFESRASPNLPPTMKSAAEQLSDVYKPLTQPVDSRLTLASTLIPDVFGNPSFILQVGVDRSAHAQGQTALHYLMVALVVVGAIFLGLMMLLLERLVLRRLRVVSRGVHFIGTCQDVALRLKPDGTDEIGHLASTINQMLQALEDGQAREHHLHAKIAELHIQIDAARRDSEVQRITDSDYFRDLTERAERLRKRNTPSDVPG